MVTKKQKAVFDYINAYTDEFGISPTQKEIKDHFDLKSFGSVQRYLNYLKEAGLLSNEWNSRRGLKPLQSLQQINNNEIPILGKIAAGNPIEAIENSDHFMSVPPTMLKSSGIHFGLTVTGESMIELGIFDGDIAIIKSQNTANNGDIVAAIIDGEATLKTYSNKGKKISLLPANKEFSPIEITNGHFHIAGVLTGILRTY